MVAYIDDHKDRDGVEPICKALPIGPSVYYEHRARNTDPARCPSRLRRDAALSPEISRVHRANLGVYRARKVWLQLHWEGLPVARCTVERLMRSQGLQGVRCGKPVWTTIPDEAADRPRDFVEGQFSAGWPNQLWVADFTYVSTWSGVVFVAFAIDLFSRRIAGWRVARSMTTDLVLDALEPALWSREVAQGFVHHSDRGSQYLSIRYSERLAEVGVQLLVGSTGDSYGNALAETVITA